MFLDVVKRGKESPFYGFYFVEGEAVDLKKHNYLSFCDVPTMPRLNTSNPAVQAYLCSVGEYWLKTFDVDGYRLDVAFDVSHAFWRLFKMRMAAIKPYVILIGEDWLNSESHLSRGEWDSVMNYPFRLALIEEKEGDKGARWLAERLNGLLMRYNENSDRMMLNLLSSHDVPRYLTLIGGDKNFFFQSYALMMFYPGWPCLYYGDEILLEGGNDPENRKTMRWEKKRFETCDAQLMKSILALRKDPLLKNGDWTLSDSGDLFYLERFKGKKAIRLYLNLGKKAAALPPESGECRLAYLADQKEIGPGGFIVVERN
jgi:neopullulanase